MNTAKHRYEVNPFMILSLYHGLHRLHGLDLSVSSGKSVVRSFSPCRAIQGTRNCRSVSIEYCWSEVVFSGRLTKMRQYD
jgi:hypothetical protein